MLNTSDISWLMESYNVIAINKQDGKKSAFLLRNDSTLTGMKFNKRIVYADSLDEAIKLYKDSGLSNNSNIVCIMEAKINYGGNENESK